MVKKFVPFIIVAVVFAGGGFFAGQTFSQNAGPLGMQSRDNGNGTFQRVNGQGGLQAVMNGTRGGATMGEIIATDDSSITVKLQDGGSRIVLVSDSTTVSKSTTGSRADLAVGAQITAFGAQNSDGSVSAQTVQIGDGFMMQRPAD